MSNRREFIGAAGGMSLASLWPAARAEAFQEGSAGGRDLIEVRNYELETQEQRKALCAFMKDAAIPALNRIGVEPVGVFAPLAEGIGPMTMVLRHKNLETVLGSTHMLLKDEEFLSKGKAILDAPAESPAFKRMESTLLLAFKGMPQLDRPVTSPGRIFQLRIYESPSVKTGQKKIEMFNDAGEITIFKRVGLHPVFFGEAITGSKMPNLTYMLSFESEDELKANWKKFGADPDWQRLRGMAEYSDKAILCGITNILLKPTDCSQL